MIEKIKSLHQLFEINLRYAYDCEQKARQSRTADED
jgi:hypothetical protein